MGKRYIDEILNMLWIFLLCSLLSTIYCNDKYALDVAAFNVRVFGDRKFAKQEVVDNLVKIILRYDLILIQEIRDSDSSSIHGLHEKVNNEHNGHYNLALSKRTGRTSSKEAYAFLYRNDWLELIEAHTYNDVDDVFEREPFIAHFRGLKTNLNDFYVIGIHTKPTDATTEVSHLVQVYDSLPANSNAILMGDFNADCSYLTKWDQVVLATDHRFYWLVDDSMDTTSTRTFCAYDRIVIAGQQLVQETVPDSSKVFYFDEAYTFEDIEPVDVSDHYPVQFQIRGSMENAYKSSETEQTTFDKPVDIQYLHHLKSTAESHDGKYQFVMTYSHEGEAVRGTVSVMATGSSQLEQRLSELPTDIPGVITDQAMLEMTYTRFTKNNFLSRLPRGRGVFQTLHDYYKAIENTDRYDVSLGCEVGKGCFLNIEHLFG